MIRNIETLKMILTLLLCINIGGMEAIPVHFWLYTKDNLDTFEDMVFDGAEVHLNNNTLFDPSKPTKLVVHGWGGGTHIDQIFAGAYAKRHGRS